MATRRRVPPSVQRIVRERAHGLCEYCHTAEQWQYVLFTIDHVVPLVVGGTDAPDNLALACFHCNRRKSGHPAMAVSGAEPDKPLFDPRRQDWSDHFAWAADGERLVGLTDVGRATIDLLAMNRERVIAIRRADIAVGRHPPPGDPVLDT